MPHFRITILFSFLFLMCGPFPVNASQLQPRLSASPLVGHENTGVEIEAVVPRDARNRLMRLELDGPKFRAFEEQMDGEDARVLYRLVVDALPEGNYVVWLMVLRRDGSTWNRRLTLCRGSACVQGIL
jgi:hypothetical protein